MTVKYVRAFAALILGMGLASNTPQLVMSNYERAEFAKMVHGEGWHLVEDGTPLAGIALVHCAINGANTVDGWQGRLQQFHGYDRYGGTYTDLDRAVVDAAIALYPVYDVAGGAMYCVSWHDLDKANALHKIGDAELAFKRGMWGLYFFKEYPLGD